MMAFEVFHVSEGPCKGEYTCRWHLLNVFDVIEGSSTVTNIERICFCTSTVTKYLLQLLNVFDISEGLSTVKISTTFVACLRR